MRKFLGLFFLLFFFLSLRIAYANSPSDFNTTIQSTYTINTDGNTHVDQNISIKNLTEYIYTPSYSIDLGVQSFNNLQVKNVYGPLPYTVHTSSEGNKEVTINFQKNHIGTGAINSFIISFNTNDIAKKRGRVWEVDIPGIKNPGSYSNISATIYVPKSFGNPTVMKPAYSQPLSNPLYFSKAQLGPAGIYLLYGSSQIYNYNLTYHISNPNLFPITTEIALPPPTNYQRVTLDSLNPLPVNVYRDADGNWLAQYNLNPSTNVKIIAKGEIEVHSNPSPQELPNPSDYLNALPYWEVSSPEVQQVAENLQTPKDVYNYVVHHLTYNYKKASTQNSRLGAQKTLQNPTDAVCLEFTDLFVALARAKGIPARAIEGYAYTNNQKIRPSSTTEDVLHAWPEYYDPAQKTWIMVDPTWGNTTGGIDYFSSFDYDHIAFAIEGKSSTYPIPAGGYKLNNNTQDVHISFSNDKNLAEKQQAVLVSVLPSQVLSILPFSGNVTIKNTGNVAIENKTVQITSGVPLTQSVFHVNYIPPFGSKTFYLQFSNPSLLTNKTFKVTMLFEGISDSKIIRVEVIPWYAFVLIGGGVCAVIISIIAFKSRRISIQK